MPDAPPPVLGLHHVTAITADAQANHDFYAVVLGLRLVKKTVNFDDPASYHLYYGDGTGSPGSIVTFFVHPGLPRGRAGWPMVREVGWHVADRTLPGWDRRIAASSPVGGHHYGTQSIYLNDPDGLKIWLSDSVSGSPTALELDHETNPLPTEPLTAIGDVAAYVRAVGPTVDFLRRHLGLDLADRTQCQDVKWLRRGGDDGLFEIDASEEQPGRPGVGTVHHVAFRVATDADQLALREHLLSAGVNVSPVMDRTYFKSIYFREPGGVLLEVATDGPGFAVDEPVESLGQRLCLPPQYESRRAEIEAGLPPLRT